MSLVAERFPGIYSGNLYVVVDFVPRPSLGGFEVKPAIPGTVVHNKMNSRIDA